MTVKQLLSVLNELDETIEVFVECIETSGSWTVAEIQVQSEGVILLVGESGGPFVEGEE